MNTVFSFQDKFGGMVEKHSNGVGKNGIGNMKNSSSSSKPMFSFESKKGSAVMATIVENSTITNDDSNSYSNATSYSEYFTEDDYDIQSDHNTNDTDDDDSICSDHDTNGDGIDAILKQLDYFDIRSLDGIVDGMDDERISTHVTNSDHDKQLDYFDIRSLDGIVDGMDDERISTHVTNSDHDIHQAQTMGISTYRGVSSAPAPSKFATTSYTNNKERTAIDAILVQLYHDFDTHPEPGNTNYCKLKR
jgi:hypothetical protein